MLNIKRCNIPILNIIGLSVVFYAVITILFFFVTEKLLAREKNQYDKIHQQDGQEKYKK